MLLKVYVGNSSGKAKRVKKIYEGINNVAKLMYDKSTETNERLKHYTGTNRNIKKGYLGISGKAQTIYLPTIASTDYDYIRPTENLAAGRNKIAATSVGDYALFGGGYRYTNYSQTFSTVDAYSKDLVHSLPDDLYGSATEHSACSVGNYAIFGGGLLSGYGTNETCAYDINLIKNTSISYFKKAKYNVVSTSFNNYALFAGTNNDGYKILDYYNSSLVRTSTSDEISNTSVPGAGHVNSYALFLTPYGTFDIFNSSLVKSTVSISYLGASSINSANIVSFNGSMIVGGWYANSTRYSTVYRYNSSLTRSTLTSLSQARIYAGCASNNKFAIFAGGQEAPTHAATYNNVDIYDTNFVQIKKYLGTKSGYGAATNIGDYLIHAGGYNTGSYTYNEYVYAYRCVITYE